MTNLSNIIAGEATAPASGEWHDRGFTPDGRSPLDALPASDARDVDAAVDVARRAAPAWAALTPFARADALRSAAHALRAQSEHLATTMCVEIGKPIGESRAEVDNAARVLDFYAGLAHELGGDHLASARDGVHLYTRRDPRGVAAVITPWNFPVNLPVVKLAPALLAGNAVVWKPASPAAASAAAFADCLTTSTLPAGVVGMVLGGGGAVGDPLTDANINVISFTGSCEVGQELERRATSRGVRALTELGGKNAAIVCGDANLDLAVEAIIGGAFRYAGQKCTATSRVIAVEAIYNDLCDALRERIQSLVVGLPEDPSTYLGPVISSATVDFALACVDDSAAQGARVSAGGQRVVVDGAPNGSFMAPTLVTDVTTGMRIAREELFAPVLAVLRARDTDDAFTMADDSAFGLTASIFTRDLSTAFAYAERADVGAVNINLPTAGLEFQAPIGGRRGSGSGGVEQGLAALDFYTRSKSVSVRYAP